MPMTGRMLLRLSLIVAVVPLAACGGGGTKTVTVTTTTTAPAEMTNLRVYLLKDGKVQPVAREVPKTPAVASASLIWLIKGPTVAEQHFGLSNAVTHIADVALSRGVAHLSTNGLSNPALAQAVFTLTQFPTVKAVEYGGKTYTRADFEDETPIIAVESPLPFQHVTSPLRATGTANTFEATFQYELVDASGTVIAKHFVTATSGSGQRGTFDFTAPFTVTRAGLGKLVVFELSAANGQRVHVNEIPIYLER
jgi:Immunoglobulin-like domain of bacterial spore germination/Sporulation and spore germination